MNIGIKGSNNEPQAQIRWHEKSVRMGIVQHDKDDGDINGTIEVIATFVYASIRERVFRQRQEPQMKIWLN